MFVSCDDGGGVSITMTAFECGPGSITITGTSIGLAFFSCGCTFADVFVVTVES